MSWKYVLCCTQGDRFLRHTKHHTTCLVLDNSDPNHPTLYHQVKEWFDLAQAHNFQGIDASYEQRIEEHHRTEIRQVWSVPVSALGQLYQPRLWAGLRSVVMVVRVRHLWNKTTREVQFYLTSLDSDAQPIGRAIRKHWGIENQAHWTRELYVCAQMLAVFALSTVLVILHSASMSSTANRLTSVVFDKKVNGLLWIMII